MSYTDRSEIQTPRDLYERWIAEIDEGLRVEKRWRDQVRKVIKRFRDERDESQHNRSKFNILYSNIVTAKAAIYQQPPRPDVRRRFGGNDETAKRVSEVIERGLSYCIDDYDFDEQVMAAVDDYLMGGRGTLRIRYVPEIMAEADETGTEYERLTFQRTGVDYVHWSDFLTSPSRRWDDVRWIAFRHVMTREEIAELNEEAAETVGLDYSLKSDSDQNDKDELFKRAEVWEVWDKETRTVIWICRGYELPLYIQQDPLGLEGFFCVPEPLYGVQTTDTLIPVPEYALYQDLANELDDITQRISALTDMLKVRGVYDSAVEEVGMIMEAEDGTLTPAANAASLYDRGGIQSAIWMMPLESVVATLQQLYQAREAVKQTIYEVMGVSDLLRGSSDASETATAQRVKAQFGTMRLDAKKRQVQRFARDILRLKAEVLCEHFEPEILAQMTGEEITEDMVQLMRNDAMRAYKIDIETDSTVAPDAQAEQEATVKLMGSLSQMIGVVAPLVERGTLNEQSALELVRIGVQPFKGARHVMNLLDEAQGQAGQQEAQPNPEEAQQAAEMQLEQLKASVEQQKHQMELAEAEAEHQNKMLELQIERAKLEQDAIEAQALMQGPVPIGPAAASPVGAG